MSKIDEALKALQKFRRDEIITTELRLAVSTAIQALEQQRWPTLTNKDRMMIETARKAALKQLPEGDVGMTEALAPAAHCLNLIAIIERIADTTETDHE